MACAAKGAKARTSLTSVWSCVGKSAAEEKLSNNPKACKSAEEKNRAVRKALLAAAMPKWLT